MRDNEAAPTRRLANDPQGSEETGDFGTATGALAGRSAQATNAPAHKSQASGRARTRVNALACPIMKRSSCPICKGPRESVSTNPTYPFCSPRCKLADLSNWLSESYTVEGEPANPDQNDPGSHTLH
jgi:endogenous inhibitor of DNA gyrase (YacG/DUF329 family)